MDREPESSEYWGEIFATQQKRGFCPMNTEAMNWSVTTHDSSQWIVVDNKGHVIRTGFPTNDSAWNYIDRNTIIPAWSNMRKERIR